MYRLRPCESLLSQRVWKDLRDHAESGSPHSSRVVGRERVGIKHLTHHYHSGTLGSVARPHLVDRHHLHAD